MHLSSVMTRESHVILRKFIRDGKKDQGYVLNVMYCRAHTKVVGRSQDWMVNSVEFSKLFCRAQKKTLTKAS